MLSRRPSRLLLPAVAVAAFLGACGGSSESGGVIGEPAAAGDADRTVEVTASDPHGFSPKQIEVSAGETILFRVSNSGKTLHEFVLGPDEGHAHGGDTDKAIHLGPGETKELAWTFTEAGSVGFHCYVPGHNESGMNGTITISS